jgi:hypothetical protein
VVDLEVGTNELMLLLSDAAAEEALDIALRTEDFEVLDPLDTLEPTDFVSSSAMARMLNFAKAHHSRNTPSAVG